MEVQTTASETEKIVGRNLGRGIGIWIRDSLCRAHDPVASVSSKGCYPSELLGRHKGNNIRIEES